MQPLKCPPPSPADLNVATAMLAMFSLFLMVMGAICITMSLSKEILFFLKPASICFILSGEERHLRPALMPVSHCRVTRTLTSPLLLPQGSWCFCVCWSSTSLCWPYWPVTTRCLFPTSSPGLCPVSAVPERFLSWVGSSSCCWRCPTAPGRSVSLIRAAAASGPDICTLNDPPSDSEMQRYREAKLRAHDVLAKRFFYSKPN